MQHSERITTARLTGIWYLLLAISGVLGFLIFHPKIFVTDDAGKTLTNLVSAASTARIRLLLELAIILSQALAAVWFFRLFQERKAWAAYAVGGWGLMNAAAIMVSAISMGAALEVAQAAHLTSQEKLVLVQLCSAIISKSWLVGGLFFGLWLIPMGHVVVSSRCMPIWLGRTLMIGGVGYILSTLLQSAGWTHPLADLLTLPATIGEFWMIGYLLIYGIRPLHDQ